MEKLIVWQDYYSVKVAEIDEQHKKLINLLNDLYDSIEQTDSVNVKQIIQELTDYTQLHFKTEEQYFVKFHFRGTSQHFAEHSKFIKQVHEFKREYEKDSNILTAKILNYLRDWVNHHIMESDQLYVDCFTSNGLH